MIASPTPPGLLERSPEESSRLLALRFLDAARDARARLGDAADAEALHDYRVALRRLRSTLRAYRAVLADAVPRKLTRRLKKLAAATNAARDAEVQIEWLSAVASSGSERRAVHWLVPRLAESEAEERERAVKAIARRHEPLDRALRRRLRSLRVDIDLGAAAERPPVLLREWLAPQVRGHGEDLERALGAVSSVEDADAAHRARIAGKRLRYLLEPLRDELVEAQAPVAALRGLQDALGALHDAQVLVLTLADLAAAAAAERARRRILLAAERGSDDPEVAAASRSAVPAGLLALVTRLRNEQQERFRAVERGWLGDAAVPFFDGLATLAQRLEDGGSARRTEGGSDGGRPADRE